MNVPRSLAGYYIAPGLFLCQPCSKECAPSARSAAQPCYHDGERRRCGVCEELFTGPYLGSDPEMQGIGCKGDE